MPKRSRTEDANEMAFRVLHETVDRHDEPPAKKPRRKRKNPAAVALGKKGGRKGGPARAAALSDEERSQSARHAAQVRWANAKK